MEKVFASVRLSSPLPVAVARTSQSPFPLAVIFENKEAKLYLITKNKKRMNNRVNIEQTEPSAYKAMYALEKYLNTSQLSKTHLELIKIRASQINGCAFCINLHTTDALRQGETNQRIFLLNAWKETELFTEEERIILKMTEEVTLITKDGLTDETYKKAAEIFDENYIALIIMAIVTINAWNRIAVSTNKGVK